MTNWMRELSQRHGAPNDAEHDNFNRRRRRHMREGETLAQARRRWRAEGACRDCGAPLAEGATGRRCDGCRAGGNRRKGAKLEAERAAWKAAQRPL